MKRVFVAIDISEEARRKAVDRIAAFAANSRSLGIKWVKPEQLHLTVRFLGEVEDERLSAILPAVGKACREIRGFTLVLERPGVFPSPKKARVLWIGVRDESGMSGKLKNHLEKQLLSLGLPGDDKSFRPHLTLGRIKDPVSALAVVLAHLSEDFEAIQFEVGKITIYESKLLPSGAVYTMLESFDLRTD